MDDQLEQPAAYEASRKPSVNDENRAEDEEQSSDDEDGGPDWTKLSTALASSAARPVIPKRGEKDHEPAEGGETRLQSHVLDRARAAMFGALRAERGSSNKIMSHAVWYPTLARAHVIVSRGVHFASLGHSVARSEDNYPVHTMEGKNAMNPKRLELLPEEALYLVERGALSCSLASYDGPSGNSLDEGIPMTVQQTFDEVIGREDLTLEKYQVYAYLKRLGYVVTRAQAPSQDYPMPFPCISNATSALPAQVMMSRLVHILLRPLSAVHSLFKPLLHAVGLSSKFDWWRPWSCLSTSSVKSSGAQFKYIRNIIPTHAASPELVAHQSKKGISPYEVFFNLYKPVTPFKKTAPPEPDFQVVVINARTTPTPTLRELDALFAQLPELPPPVPRKRPPPPAPSKSEKQKDVKAHGPPDLPVKSVSFSVPDDRNNVPGPQAYGSSSPTKSAQTESLWARLWSTFSRTPALTSNDGLARPPPRPNPFPSLKQGRKMIVIAVVDAGSLGFFRFGQGTFEEWPMA